MDFLEPCIKVHNSFHKEGHQFTIPLRFLPPTFLNHSLIRPQLHLALFARRLTRGTFRRTCSYEKACSGAGRWVRRRVNNDLLPGHIDADNIVCV